MSQLHTRAIGLGAISGPQWPHNLTGARLLMMSLLMGWLVRTTQAKPHLATARLRAQTANCLLLWWPLGAHCSPKCPPPPVWPWWCTYCTVQCKHTLKVCPVWPENNLPPLHVIYQPRKSINILYSEKHFKVLLPCSLSHLQKLVDYEANIQLIVPLLTRACFI